jgi:hypothetical protein
VRLPQIFLRRAACHAGCHAIGRSSAQIVHCNMKVNELLQCEKAGRKALVLWNFEKVKYTSN